MSASRSEIRTVNNPMPIQLVTVVLFIMLYMAYRSALLEGSREGMTLLGPRDLMRAAMKQRMKDDDSE